MSGGGAILASLLVTIGRPTWWLLALTGFLVRGGFVVFTLPIVILPSPLAISDAVGPAVVPIALGRVGIDAIALLVIAVAILFAWLIVAGWIAAATDLALIREAAAAAIEEGVGAPAVAASDGRDRTILRRLLLARLIAWLPFAAALAVGTVRIVAIVYAQLTRPAEVASPLALRVALDAAPELVVIAVSWLLGELIGGMAGRRIVLGGAPPGQALIAAAGDVVRRPRAVVLPWVLTTGLLLTILAGSIGAAGIAWSRIVLALTDRPVDPRTVALNVILFVAIWLAALVLAGLFAAFRGSVQTFEAVRRQSATGTFGASAHHRPGDWSIPDEGGSL